MPKRQKPNPSRATNSMTVSSRRWPPNQRSDIAANEMRAVPVTAMRKYTMAFSIHLTMATRESDCCSREPPPGVRRVLHSHFPAGVVNCPSGRMRFSRRDPGSCRNAAGTSKASYERRDGRMRLRVKPTAL